MKRDRADGAGVAKNGAAPSELTPNRLTAETLAKSERGEDLHSGRDAEDLFDQLGAPA